MALRTYNCPNCKTELTKSDKLYLLSQAHEEPRASVVLTSPLGPVTCPRCHAAIPADRIVAGAYDVRPPLEPTAPPSLAWVLFCPIPGALAGFIGMGILLAIPSWLFSFEVPIVLPIIGAAIGAVAFFLGNLKWYRQGYTPPGVAKS